MLTFARRIAELAALGLGVAYGLGLVVSNVSLSRYGVTNTELARPEYVMTGLLAMCLLGAAMAVATSAGYFCVQASRWFSPRPVFLWGLASLVVICIGVFGFLLWILSGAESPGTAAVCVRDLMLMGGFLAFIPVLWAHVAKQYRDENITSSGRFKWPWWDPMRVAAAAMGGAALLVAIFGYSLLVFPELAREYGGGKYPYVMLTLTGSADLSANSADFRELMQGNVLGPVTLLSESGDRYVVAVIGSGIQRGDLIFQSLALRKELVQSVRYSRYSRRSL